VTAQDRAVLVESIDRTSFIIFSRICSGRCGQHSLSSIKVASGRIAPPRAPPISEIRFSFGISRGSSSPSSPTPADCNTENSSAGPRKSLDFRRALCVGGPSVRGDSDADWLVMALVIGRSAGLDVDDPVLNQVNDDLNLAQSLNDAVYGCRTRSSVSPAMTFRRPALSAISRLEPRSPRIETRYPRFARSHVLQTSGPGCVLLVPTQ